MSGETWNEIAYKYFASRAGVNPAQPNGDGSQNIGGVDGTTKASDTNYVPVGQSTASRLNAQVQGNVAAAAADSGNPVKIGAPYSTDFTPVTAGQRVSARADQYGNIRTLLVATLAAGADNVGNNQLLAGAAQGGLGGGNNLLQIAPYDYDGTSWYRKRGDITASFSKAPPLAVTVSAVTAASTSSQQLFAASATRSKLFIQNQDAVINIFIMLGASATVAPPSMRISPGQTLELNGTNQAVNIIAASGTPAVAAWAF